jgi:hypothetical protein
MSFNKIVPIKAHKKHAPAKPAPKKPLPKKHKPADKHRPIGG